MHRCTDEAYWRALPVFFSLSAMSAMADNLPDPVAAGWRGQRVCETLSESAEIRVFRCTFPPGVGHERHFHPKHFGYALSGGTMRITDAAGTREALGWSHPPFEVPNSILDAWRAAGEAGRGQREAWDARHAAASQGEEFNAAMAGAIPESVGPAIEAFKREMSETAPGLALGQGRAMEAVTLGAAITAPGYNLFVMGSEGTGRQSAMLRFLYQRAQGEVTPSDWVYVHDFGQHHRPRAAGQGHREPQGLLAAHEVL